VRRHPVLLATVISALLSAIYLAWTPQTTDLAAQTFRADLWERSGWVLWNDSWYSGHVVPGYSLIYPPLGALLGPALLGAFCAVATAALSAQVAVRAFGERAWLGAAWLGLASVTAIYGGRTTFALGLVFGVAAIFFLQRDRALPAGLAAVLAGLASPVAGLFVALAAAAVLLAALGHHHRQGGAGHTRAALSVVISASLTTVLLAAAFPTGGFQPLGFWTFVWIPIVCIAALTALPDDQRVLRWAALLYLLVGIAAIAIQTPFGSNAVRLGATFAGPVLALALFSRRPRLLALLAVPLLYWQLDLSVRDVVASKEPSTERVYYEPLLDELERRAGPEPLRLEVTASRTRWEAVYLAPEVPLARGWLRQLESADIEGFAEGRLTPTAYQQWLYRHGVSHIALSDAELDYIAEEEAALLESGLDFTREVWSSEHWRLFEVLAADGTDPPPEDRLAFGGAEVVELGPDGFSVRVPEPGEYLLALRYTPYFEVDAGEACLEAADGVSTRLTALASGPQTIEVGARLSLDGLLRRERTCSDFDLARSPP